MTERPDSDRKPVPRDEDEAREAAEAAQFAAALQAFEHAEPKPAEKAPRGVTAPRVGQRVRGRIVAVNGDVLLLDIGGRSEAVADAREFRSEAGELTVKVGDALDLHVAEAGETLTLARGARRQGGRVSLAALRQARTAGLAVRGKVTAVNTGGLTVDVNGVRAFCPVSQIDDHFVEDTSSYVGRVLEFLVSEVDESRSRAVLSRRRLLQQEAEARAKERLAALAPGQDLDGTVTRMEPFGAFVDLGGVEGLVHVSEISHARVSHPREVVSAGEKVRVRVLKLDTGKDGRPRVALSLKAVAPDPWAAAAQTFTPGQRVPGVVVRLADFGAFVNLAPGVDGLVHISQVSHTRVAHARDVLSPGQAVEVVVLAVDPERRRISLSIRDAVERPVEPSRMSLADRPRSREPQRRPPRGPGRETPRGARRLEAEAPDPRPAREEPPALTAMQLAFQRAREAQKKKEQTS
jgi:small subunit ribosomal protein S1